MEEEEVKRKIQMYLYICGGGGRGLEIHSAEPMGRKGPVSFARKVVLPRQRGEVQPVAYSPDTNDNNGGSSSGGNAVAGNLVPLEGGSSSKGGKKKPGGSRLWMRFDRSGQTELFECDKSVIVRRAAVPARDLRFLGPLFSHSSSILAREKAMIVNLEFVKAIITAQEVLVLDPISQEVLPFVDQLRQQLTLRSPLKTHNSDNQEQEMGSPMCGQWVSVSGAAVGELPELPFEFQVLEIALETVCTYLDSCVADLEKDAYPWLDELAKNVSTKNLERVRCLKTNLTRLLARVQKVRDEIEHLLDDDEDMAHLYLTRKQKKNQQFGVLMVSDVSSSILAAGPNLGEFDSFEGSRSLVNSVHSGNNDVEDLEMLFEAYFVQLDSTRSKILSVREYIDDTEDYVNIQLDNQRNELIQLQLMLIMASFAIALNTLTVGIFSMNIPCSLFQLNSLFVPFVGGTSGGCFFIFLILLGYAKWKKLLGS